MNLPPIHKLDAEPRHVVELYDPSTSFGYLLRVTSREYNILADLKKKGTFLEKMQSGDGFSDWINELIEKRELLPERFNLTP